MGDTGFEQMDFLQADRGVASLYRTDRILPAYWRRTIRTQALHASRVDPQGNSDYAPASGQACKFAEGDSRILMRLGCLPPPGGGSGGGWLKMAKLCVSHFLEKAFIGQEDVHTAHIPISFNYIYLHSDSLTWK